MVKYESLQANPGTWQIVNSDKECTWCENVLCVPIISVLLLSTNTIRLCYVLTYPKYGLWLCCHYHIESICKTNSAATATSSTPRTPKSYHQNAAKHRKSARPKPETIHKLISRRIPPISGPFRKWVLELYGHAYSRDEFKINNLIIPYPVAEPSEIYSIESH